MAKHGLEQIAQSVGEGRSPLLVDKAISSHLKELGYPKTSLESMAKCGFKTGYKLFMVCDNCGTKIYDMKYSCNLRTCPRCSHKRKRRILREYLPYFKQYPSDRNKDHFYFLTISPKNYDNFDEGLAHIKKSFNKFIRLKYIRDRVQGGIWTIETKKHDGKGWHIHLHVIFYGRRLDNVIRGKCLKCGQTYIKFDTQSKKYYCSNRKCNSTDVVTHKNSKLVQLFNKSSGRENHIFISRQTSPRSVLNYCLKYVSVDKSEFSNPNDVAQYIYSTRKQKLINTFGLFFNNKPSKLKPICPICGSPLSFVFDIEVSQIITAQKERPPDLLCYCQSRRSLKEINPRVS